MFEDKNLPIKVLIIDQCQGLQSPVVLFDTVRSENSGFMGGQLLETSGDKMDVWLWQ